MLKMLVLGILETLTRYLNTSIKFFYCLIHELDKFIERLIKY
jgi:hypothetical protein